MQKEQLDDLYSQLKITGVKAEALINDWIKTRINKEDIVGLISRRSKFYSKLIQEMQDIVETTSIPLNFPTKRDVASVARLTIQNEEKLDEIERRLRGIELSMHRIESALHTNSTSEFSRTQQRKASNKVSDRAERAKRVQENLAKLSEALLNPPKIGE